MTVPREAAQKLSFSGPASLNRCLSEQAEVAQQVISQFSLTAKLSFKVYYFSPFIKD